MRLVVLVVCCLAVFIAPSHAAAPRPCSAGSVALTFDDGPGPHTRALLDALARHGLRATMFDVGAHAAAHPDLVRAQVRARMWVENHSFSHRPLTRGDAAADLAAAQAVLRRLTGRTPTLMRPPYLATDARVEAAARRLGLRQVLATVDSRDSKGASAGEIARAAERLEPGGILLLHERPETVAAIPRIADVLTRRGLCAGPIVVAP